MAVDPNHPALGQLPTPALVIDVAALDRNIARMAAHAEDAGMALRPHIKTHKSVEIARRQIASGAKGLACATVAELLHLVEAGLDDILLTSPIADPMKADLIAQANMRAKIAVVIDHPLQAALLSEAVGRHGGALDVLVDIDVGQNRSGVADIESCIAVARAIDEAADLRLAGIQGFAGQAQHVVAEAERRQAAADVAAYLTRCRDALATEGFSIDWVSGSGTGTSRYDMDGGPFTELQVGSYVFMDADYGRLEGGPEAGLDFERSLFVLATVVSVSRAGQVTIDAGVKAFAVNGPLPQVVIGVDGPIKYAFAGDEHGILKLGENTIRPSLGDRVLVEATHCDPTVNLYAGFNAIDMDGRVERWEIGGRYA
ncbi:MAG TPA: alanine racemase [Paracoccaceae bacterium]|nr:alanine racemase [Paracoccaceae bacterium]